MRNVLNSFFYFFFTWNIFYFLLIEENLNVKTLFPNQEIYDRQINESCIKYHVLDNVIYSKSTTHWGFIFT